MKTYGGVEVQFTIPSQPGCFTAVEIAPGTHWIGGWMGHRAGLDTVKNRKSCP
jgi:hypothetical protein